MLAYAFNLLNHLETDELKSILEFLENHSEINQGVAKSSLMVKLKYPGKFHVLNDIEYLLSDLNSACIKITTSMGVVPSELTKKEVAALKKENIDPQRFLQNIASQLPEWSIDNDVLNKLDLIDQVVRQLYQNDSDSVNVHTSNISKLYEAVRGYQQDKIDIQVKSKLGKIEEIEEIEKLDKTLNSNYQSCCVPGQLTPNKWLDKRIDTIDQSYNTIHSLTKEHSKLLTHFLHELATDKSGRDEFEHKVKVIEKYLDVKVEDYCMEKNTLFGKKIPAQKPEKYIEYLNHDQSHHHFYRMLALTLTDIYKYYGECLYPSSDRKGRSNWVANTLIPENKNIQYQFQYPQKQAWDIANPMRPSLPGEHEHL